MKIRARRASLALMIAVTAGGAFAASHAMEVYETRNALMKEMGKNLGTLGKMAKGEIDYDAASAAEAAAALKAAAEKATDAELWAEGSDSMAIEKTRALPEIWDNMDDFQAKGEELIAAAAAVEMAAPQGLQEMQAAMGEVGKSCGGCHKAYRAPEQ